MPVSRSITEFLLILWDNKANMNMSKKILYIVLSIIVLSGCFSLHAQEGDRLVAYPVPPDTMVNLQARCDYIVNRYWLRCKFDYAMLHPDKFHEAFGNWANIMPLASADSVHHAINELLEKFKKKGPETLALARIARQWLYSDTTQLRSDEIYMPFARAAAEHKKIKKEDRAIFAADYKRMSASALGQTVPDVDMLKADGTSFNLGDVKNGSVLLFFETPGNVDSSVARIRLQTNPDVRELVDRGDLVIVSINPGEPTDEWKANASKLPEKWIVASMPDANDYFDLRVMPQLIYLNSSHKVLGNNMDYSHLIPAFEMANKLQKRKNQSKPANE